jgi:hypothetical protein
MDMMNTIKNVRQADPGRLGIKNLNDIYAEKDGSTVVAQSSETDQCIKHQENTEVPHRKSGCKDQQVEKVTENSYTCIT